jgi:hypothetical protein
MYGEIFIWNLDKLKRFFLVETTQRSENLHTLMTRFLLRRLFAGFDLKI